MHEYFGNKKDKRTLSRIQCLLLSHKNNSYLVVVKLTLPCVLPTFQSTLARECTAQAVKVRHRNRFLTKARVARADLRKLNNNYAENS